MHDEIQVDCEESIGKEVGDILVNSFRLAGEYYNMKIPIDAEYKIGKDWAETH